MYQTDKEELTVEDIAEYLEDYANNPEYLPKYKKLLRYYRADDTKIIDKPKQDPNNPDNRTVAPYGRKIVTTYTGYGYRPKYTTYKSENTEYMTMLQDTFNATNEHIKTSQHGRNSAIFGMSYELLYVAENQLTGGADTSLAVFDPRSMFLVYSNDIEPVRKFGIRFYNVGGDTWAVIVYTDKTITTYSAEWAYNKIDLTLVSQDAHFFGKVPIIKFAMPDDMGIIEPVLSLIDDYDELLSGCMNEQNRFANAYLRLVGMSFSDQKKSANPNIFKATLAAIKQRRVFEQLKSPDDVTFLTKDIPTDYMRFMSELIREQIHVQSHVPDFGKFNDLSGIAVQRLMFDFENVVSSAEAEFDTALYERIELITRMYQILGKQPGEPQEITINHKRNTPLNLKEFADTAEVMKRAGFSSYLCADVMPDDIMPDVDAELARQEEERQNIIPDIDQIYPEPVADTEQGATDEPRE